ncbi:sugar diacid utilization regulator [Sphaerochaeta pleomorpha str. Grapes]|uniref:Sugar diacid utilization regulator n=1 Tax=Sphaerochaeta pleomorpha (strain ATCC BAA-1885 / DSM 22778 / Grapes) TaxID=158190 RepID=G8QST3_SPHPG|nr:sugar diacid recognition domain-containing protein [Sphaerochaeta pleomorpha]AEV30115.1 sugar diacid utilization regulator [Sphaerochaeta pleomorpha str. Grapes]
MEISQRDADEIVKELSNLTKLKLNIVNSDAIIIANSDPQRVGDFHEATKKIIDEKLDELVVMDTAQYKGTCAGTNLPIVIDHQIVGVVGITGPYKEAVSYGKIIKKMTEILIQGKERENEKTRNKIARTRFQIEWICNAQTEVSEALKERGRDFGIDITVHRRIMVISLNEIKGESSPYSKLINLDSIEDSIEREILLLHASNTAFKTSNVLVATLIAPSDAKLLSVAENLLKKFSNPHIAISIGIDEACEDYLKIHEQYSKALKAQISARQRGSNAITFYSDLDLELLLSDISEKTRQSFMNKVFSGFSEEEILQSMKTIQVLYEENGSIYRAADRLNEHPNTLQYKLRKIERDTGYDPRKLGDAAVFNLALLFRGEYTSTKDKRN